MEKVNKPEKILEGLSPKPIPPELKERILSKAYQRRSESFVISPALQKMFAFCSVLIVLAFFSDILIKNSENEFLTSILNGSQVPELALEKNLKEMRGEIFRIDYDRRFDQLVVRHYKAKRSGAKLSSLQRILDILKE